MRWLAAAAGIVIASGNVGPASAATVSSHFGVGAVVAASCRLALGESIVGIPFGGACSPAASPSAAPTPRPLVFVTHDVATGTTRVNVEF
ncbi:MAG TPA: hypothetical protein VGR91_17790 [Stellaceae bacterium]|nr:hypothetical protein [Stellaceae bacterium]